MCWTNSLSAPPSSVETDCGRDAEDAKQSMATSSTLTGPDDPGQESKKSQHPKGDKWRLLRQTKEARLHLVAVLWRKMGSGRDDDA
jgi:hypothetical protein